MMKWISSGLFALLAVPAIAAFFYSVPPSPVSLALSLASLLLYVGAVSWLAGCIPARLWRALFLFLMAGLMLVYQCAHFLSNYFLGEGFGESFFYHMNLDTVLQAWRAYPGVSIVFTLSLVPLLLLSWLGSHPHAGRGRVWPAIIVMVLAIPVDPELRRLSVMAARDMSREQTVSIGDVEWEALALNREALNSRPAGAEAGKNLVLLYMEGLEQLYTEEEVFPGLTPNLDRLARQGLQFNDIRQTSGTEWTVGGMVASLCGTPLLSDRELDGNSVLFARFLDRGVCLSDVLEAAGYTQQFMGGASTRFAGKGSFLSSHGYDRVLGSDELLETLEDPDYRTGWGLYDDSMLDRAAEEFRRLADQDAPFNLTLLTLDTHHPSGFLSASCSPYERVDNSMLDAVHCSDQLIDRFLERISGHPAWEDTVVVLVSDHLGMRHNAYSLFPDDYPRRLFFTVLNAEESGTVDTPGTTMDVAPTVLELMDVQHDVRFLAGLDLLGEEAGKRRSSVFRDQRRNRALRSINSEVLSTTAGDRGVCDRPIMLAGVPDNALTIGSHSLPLVDGGNPLDLERFIESHVATAIFDRQRNLQGTLVSPAEQWSERARGLPMGAMLMAGRHSQLRSLVALSETDIPDEHLLVTLGYHGQGFRVLDHASGPAGLRVSPAVCEQAFSELGL